MCARAFGLHRRAISSVIRFPNDFIALLQVIELVISLLGEIPLSLEFSFILDNAAFSKVSGELFFLIILPFSQLFSSTSNRLRQLSISLFLKLHDTIFADHLIVLQYFCFQSLKCFLSTSITNICQP